jgi:hypothetical protein
MGNPNLSIGAPTALIAPRKNINSTEDLCLLLKINTVPFVEVP